MFFFKWWWKTSSNQQEKDVVLSQVARLVGRRWDILEKLYNRNYTATDLNKDMGKESLSWVSSQLKGLREAKLVDYEKGADKRSKLYSLTNRGRRICSTYFQELQPISKRVIDDEKEIDIWLRARARIPFS